MYIYFFKKLHVSYLENIDSGNTAPSFIGVHYDTVSEGCEVGVGCEWGASEDGSGVGV